MSQPEEQIYFGDADILDAWDRDDAIVDLLVNLSRRLDLLHEPATVPADAPVESVLDDIRHRLGRARQHMTEEQRLRVEWIVEDIEWVFGRLEEERDDD